jgi:excinuclease ABC subunit A
MAKDKIIIKGAREHNLQGVDVEIPRDKLTVLTGVSGSGKSSLAFDTLYAEGQRRYVESLSAYARQFLGQMEKPKVDFIEGLSPSIAIEQKSTSKNPRSTVGTVTEIYDYLRLLFARIGVPHSPETGREIGSQTAEQMVDRVLDVESGRRFMVLAPLVQQRKGEYREVFAEARAEGFVRVRVDGEIHDLGDEIKLNKKVKHTIEVVVDRLVMPQRTEHPATPEGDGVDEWAAFVTRLTDSIETALRLGDGKVLISLLPPRDAPADEKGEEWLMSETNTCPDTGISYPDLTPQLFSFNSPQGACPTCLGLGTIYEVDPARLIPNPTLTLHEGAVLYWGELGKKRDSWAYRALRSIAEHGGFDLDTPWDRLTRAQRDLVLYGSGKQRIRFTWESERGSRGEFHRTWEGLASEIKRRYNQTESDWSREFHTQFMSEQPCPACKGGRLQPYSLAVTVAGLNIQQMGALSIDHAYAWVQALLGEASNTTYIAPETAQQWAETPMLAPMPLAIAGEILKEIRERLGFLLNVGLYYLSLDRPAPTLSGGEAQRIRLASQIGSGLVGVTYILDEPSIGLHQRDNRKLLNSLLRLRDLGNTLVVVEHDLDTMHAADWLIDFGPGAGIKGGRVVAAGPPEHVADSESLTGAYLSGRLEIAMPEQRRAPRDVWLEVQGAQMNNLREIDVRFPLGCFIAVTGVSGSGKSSLISETLHPALAATLHRAQVRPGPHRSIAGIEHLDKVINIDQQPIGRTPRSNPATYVKLFDLLRGLFAQTPEAKLRGYTPGRFSFNVKGGRCEACEGNGIIRIDMQFLADVWVTCDACKGKRYNRETLQVKYKGKTIADVLDMDVQTALDFFESVPRVRRILQTLHDVGLDYIRLGQAATTLSGGEAQRVKLAKELARVATGRTLYILDEPTTGLHFADVQNLLQVLHRLVDAGNTVVVIEHNLDVIKTADWLIDLGPEGGDGGGQIVAQGPPEQVAEVERSFTGQFLRDLLLARQRAAA